MSASPMKAERGGRKKVKEGGRDGGRKGGGRDFALQPMLLSEPEASWPCIKEKRVNCCIQAAIWVPEAISEACS